MSWGGGGEMAFGIYPNFGKGHPLHEMGYVCMYGNKCEDVCAGVCRSEQADVCVNVH